MRESGVYYWELRWRIPPEDVIFIDERAKALILWLKEIKSDRFIFQCEDSKLDTVTDFTLDYKCNLHFQGWIHVKVKGRPTEVAKNLNHRFLGIRLKPCSNAGIEALKEYCMKNETRVSGPWADHPIVPPRDKIVFKYQDLFIWQKKWADFFMKTKPDSRMIHWFVDPAGQSGKSTLADYLVEHHYALIVQLDEIKNMKMFVTDETRRACYIVDLTRAEAKEFSKNDLYSFLEQLKNGIVRSGKYKGGLLEINPPHVLVLSNDLPDLKQMTGDRWTVIHLSKESDRLSKLALVKEVYEYDLPVDNVDQAVAAQEQVDMLRLQDMDMAMEFDFDL